MVQTDKVVSYPLTIPQKEIWFSQMLAPESFEYNIGGDCPLDGSIDLELLEQAINHVIRTTDALRLRFFTDENLVPRQYVSSDCESNFRFIDVSDAESPEQAKDRILCETLEQPFQLIEAPLYRFKLIKLASERFVYVFFFHHLITDGWSISLINNLIAENYNLSLQGQPYTGEQDSYLNFVEEDHQYRESERFAQQRAYWLEKLKTVPELPFRSQYLIKDSRDWLGGFHQFVFDRSICDRLEAIAKQANSTLFPAFLGLFYAHLHLIEQAEGCVIGFPTLNRTGKFKRTPGLFTGVSIGCLDYGTDLSFLDLVEKIAAELKQNYRHIRFPISEVSRASRKSDHQTERLFDLTISYEKHQHLYHFGDSSGRGGSFGERPQGIPLDIHIRDYDPEKDPIMEFSYGRAYFHEQDIQVFTRQFLWLTEQFIANPTLPLDQIERVPPEERAAFERWNQPAFPLPADITVIDLFENRVSTNLDQPALIVEGVSVSYGELNQQANRIAHLLQSLEIGQDSIVGICMEKRPALYAAILGILKAGAGYLPIDPDSPDDRIRYTLDDAGCHCIVTTHEIQERVALDPELCIDVASIATELEALPSGNPSIHRAPESLAYVIYTSGSTGNPKGVMVEHRNLLNAILSYQHSWNPTPKDRGIQQASIAFDVSVCEIFSILCSGGTLLVTAKETMLDSRRLADFVADHQITFLGATPLLLNNLQQIGCSIPSVRKIFSGGESLSYNHIREFLPNAEVINGYGPTETTIGATAHIVTEKDAYRLRIPIGRPLPNYEIYILDAKQHPLPIGAPGELYVGGIALARGYLNRPELTAERFVQCEVFGVPKRLYRTGDLTRWLPDGTIEFLGRLDHQIKLRGYRIELGEIESVLASHPAIKEAVVVLHRPESAQARLVGYYVPNDQGAFPRKAELHTFLSQTLPPYMVPSALIALDRLPTNTSGKIDRKALPEPEPEEAPELRPPETPIEKDLIRIWSEVLGTAVESTNVSFFQLGGHSLLSTQIISKIRDLYGVELPFQVFFEKSVLHEQARWIEEARESSSVTEIATITPAEELTPSLAQLRLLFLAQLDDNRTLYDMFAALEFKGVLDDEALERSLCKLVEHHDSLRSAFPGSATGPRLVLLDPFNPLTQTDISHLPSEEKTARLEEWCTRERDTPLDLEQGPLIRFHNIKLDENLRVLCLKMHHTISDGWSTGVLFRDWSRFYESYRKGQEPTDVKPTLQYPDYAAWQKTWMASPAFEKQLAYWKEALNGLPERIELPTDFPRPQKLRYRGSYYRSTLPKALTAGVKGLGKAHNVTEFMTLLAAFEVLLARYSGQGDFAVGSPIANRNRSQTEGMIGLFVNTLVLRAGIQPDQTFAEILKHTRQTTLNGFHHQDLPLEALVEAINPERNLSHAPLFQVLFVHQPPSGNSLNFDGIRIRFLPQQYEVAKFDLTLSIFEESGQFMCEWEYDTDLYTRPTIERMSSHFQILLEHLIANPKQAVGSIDFLSEDERNQFVRWNDTAMPIPEHTVCLDLFEQQVRDLPEQTAIVFEATQLSYAQLDRKANTIAQTLRQGGIAREEIVAFCMERSPDAVAAMLGIMKAGGAFVPIDLNLPDSRIAYILEDCSARFLISHPPVIGRLPCEDLTIINVSELPDEPDARDTLPLRPPAPNDLAYLIYTSGSTGKPKGVMIEHLGLLNMILGYRMRYQSDPQDRALQQASLAFDVGVAEVLCTLCNGATVVMVPKETILDADQLKAFLRQHRITLFGSTPALLANLRIEPVDLPDLRLIFSGGEAVNWNGIRHCLKAAQIENGYGPTEASISTTVYTIQQEDEHRPSIPIGKPLPNYQVFILDRNHQPQPIRVPGELCIAGIGLAREYLNNRELTEEKFLELPLFGRKVRIYKTGDLARWLSDGNIEFLGRVDNQVKLRGFRIELGEIENAIRAIDIVKEATVVVHKKHHLEQLIAYVTLTQQIEDASQTIKASLEKELPGYMCPKHILVVPYFPLTANGKIDRKALPEPDLDSSQDAPLPPESEQEIRLCEIWSDLFRRPISSVNQNFFETGGHSLLAMQLVSRIRDAFAIDMPLRVLFEHTDIRSQAAWIWKNQAEGRLPEIQPLGDVSETDLSYAQQRLWFIEKLNGQNDSYNICTFIHLEGTLDLQALERTFVSIAERHETLRSRFVEVDGQAIVQIEPGFNPLEVVQNKLDHQNLDNYLKAFSKQPFDLANDPLFVAKLIPLAQDEHALLIKMHHIVSDGWSLELLSHEINHFYNAYCQQIEPTIAPLSIQYGDFAREQRKWLKGSLLTRQLEYWKQQLKGIPERLELPTDFRQPDAMSTRGFYYEKELSPKLSETIQAFSLEHGVTRFMTLLAAFDILLARYSRMEDIVVGSPVANRNRKETEDLIGFFVNNLVLRNRVDQQNSFAGFVKEVRKTTLEAYTHQDVPFERIVETVNPQRNLNHAPLFQVVFTFRNESADPLDLRHLKIRYLVPETDEIAIKNDLTLEVYESGGKLHCVWAYCKDLFRHDSISRMAENFVSLLEGLMHHPQEPLTQVSMLTEQDEALIREWNQTDKDYPHEQTVLHRIARQARVHPEHIALEYKDQHLTYGKLETESNRIAHHLIKLGVGGQTPVAVCMDRSLEYTVYILAILKAGGAFVPIDTSFPVSRIEYILKDSEASVLMTQSPLAATFRRFEGVTVITEAELASDTIVATTTPDIRIEPNHLAYIIYTSGSTGNPKGVLIEHRSLTNLVFAKNELFEIVPEDRYLQQASYAFDFSVMNTFVALSHGATLLTPDKSTLLDPTEFKRYLIDRKITVTGSTPSFSANLSYSKAETPHLRLIIFGGEAFSLGHHEASLGAIRMINAYGPTEITVAATMHEASYKDIDRKVPIGKPMANYRVHILGNDLQPLPIGVPGELCVEGVGLARGYLKRPELTAERFVNTRIFGKEVRLYRTGDLARWLPEGIIEFLGRVDFQVKFRGYRFELEEIEAVLKKMHAINEAVVDIRDSVSGQLLVAFVTLNEPIPDLTRILREALKTMLPDYMVPTFFLELPEMPLSHTGKVDRKALKAHDLQELLHTDNQVEPETPTEKQLAQIWQSLLGVEKLSIHDNFFDLGGHSLLAPKLISRIEHDFGFAFSLKDLFQFPTLQQQAVLLDRPTSHSLSIPAESGIDFVQEIILPKTITPQRQVPPEQIKCPREILLTGATGFLGTWLLYELLQQTDAKIICLVRRRPGGNNRIREFLQKHQLWQDSYEDRISVIDGDLQKPRLGLYKATFELLCQSVDTIYHNGAWVNHTYPYEALKAVNVGATLELLNMACSGRPKSFHFVSTFSAISNAEEEGKTRGEILEMLSNSNHGYAQTKWVAEQLTREAGNRGLQTTIYRPRRIAGHSETGDFNPDDFISLLLKGCAQLGSYPVISDSIRENLIPVDSVCKVLVRLSLLPHSEVRTVNLLNSQSVPWNRLFEKLADVTPIKSRSYTAWRNALARTPDNALYPFLSVFPEDLVEPDAEKTESSEQRLFEQTREKLTGEPIEIPFIDDSLLNLYFQKFKTTKYFDSPA